MEDKEARRHGELPRNILIRLIGLISLMKRIVSTHTDLSLSLWPAARTRRIKRTETRRVLWKISEKGASAPLRALARFKSTKKGRCDAEDAADEIRRENGEKTN